MVDAARVGGSTPSYQHGLAVLGQYLNSKHANRITIAEVDTGFLLYFFTGARWTKPASVPVRYTELLELTDTVAGNTAGKDGILLKGGDQRDKKNPLCPMGYDVFLRAVGTRLDRRSAVSITIAETRERFYINYWVDKSTFVIRDGRRQPVSTVQMETYDADGIKRLMRATSETQAQEMTRHERGLRVNPHDHISMMDAAFMFESDGNYRDAEILFNRIAAAVPEHPEVYYQIARLALAKGDKRAASTAIKRALKLNPNDASVFDLNGRILQKSGKLKDAIAAFERAVELEPENGIMHYHLSKVYEAAGRADDAVVQMALSANLNAAPAWDMVQEDIAIEVRPAEQAPALEKLPAEAAYLPPAAEPAAVDVSVAPPTMTTSFEPSVSAWPTTGVAASAGSSPWPSSGFPSLTTFDGQPTTFNPAPDLSLPPPMTLEQRMQAARGASLESRQRPAAEPPARQPEPFAYVSPALEPVETEQPWTAPAPQPASVPAAAPVDDHFVSEPPEQLEQPEIAPPVAPPERMRQRPAAQARQSAGAPRSRPRAEETAASAAAEEPRPAAPQPSASSADASANAVEIAAEIMMIQRALETEPNRADLHRKLGFLLARQGKTAEAATEFRKALQASRTSL
jgi:tetratricopeptide (TPR) repeat protein